MVMDKTGRKLKIAAPVDVLLIGMFSGKLIGIKEQPIVLSPQQQIAPHVIIAVSITPYIMPNGYVPDVYIVGEPDPKDPLVMDQEERSRIMRPS